MDGYKHLSIEEREDIMVRWKDHEGVSQIARELGRDKSTASREIGRNGWRGPSGRVYRASTAQGRSRRAAATLQAPQAHERPGEARPGRGADEERVLVPGADIRPQRDGAAGPGRERREHLPSRAVGGGTSTASFRGTGRRPSCSGTMEREGARRASGSAGARSSPTRRGCRARQGPRLLLPFPSAGPTRTQTGSSGTGSRKARASTTSPTTLSNWCTICSTGDRASVRGRSTLGKSAITSRCTCSESSPRDSQSSKPLLNQFLTHCLFSPAALFASDILSGRLPPLFNL
jgi:hypothetical protein